MKKLGLFSSAAIFLVFAFGFSKADENPNRTVLEEGVYCESSRIITSLWVEAKPCRTHYLHYVHNFYRPWILKQGDFQADGRPEYDEIVEHFDRDVSLGDLCRELWDACGDEADW